MRDGCVCLRVCGGEAEEVRVARRTMLHWSLAFIVFKGTLTAVTRSSYLIIRNTDK